MAATYETACGILWAGTIVFFDHRLGKRSTYSAFAYHGLYWLSFSSIRSAAACGLSSAKWTIWAGK
jgi:hypothetical protein